MDILSAATDPTHSCCNTWLLPQLPNDRLFLLIYLSTHQGACSRCQYPVADQLHLVPLVADALQQVVNALFVLAGKIGVFGGKRGRRGARGKGVRFELRAKHGTAEHTTV